MSNIGNKETMSKNLKYYIERSGRSQKEIADELGFAYSTFNEWVKGKKYPRIDKIEIMADFFGILKSDLIEEKLTEEMRKENDIMVDVVVRMKCDDEFLNVVERIYDMDSSRLDVIKQFLAALNK